MNSKLPDKLSDGLILALQDLEKCEQAKNKFTIDMGVWYLPQTNSTCAVCLAGSVIAQTLGIHDTEHELFPEDLLDNGLVSDLDVRKLAALNYVRLGAIAMAVNNWTNGESVYGGLFGVRPMTNYHDNISDFKSDMAAVIADLQSKGL